MSEYLQEFKDNDDVISEFGAPPDALAGATVHLAWYGLGSYCGEALVVFEKEGQLFEVNGSHCSCFGLEDQWQPEETSWQALALRKFGSDYCDGEKTAEEKLKALIKEQS